MGEFKTGLQHLIITIFQYNRRLYNYTVCQWCSTVRNVNNYGATMTSFSNKTAEIKPSRYKYKYIEKKKTGKCRQR